MNQFTVKIDRLECTICLIDKKNIIFQVPFKNNSHGLKIFELICSVALIQNYYSKQVIPTSSLLIEQPIWDLICKHLNIECTQKSFDVYWSHVRNANSNVIKIPEPKNTETTKNYCTQIFGTARGGHFLGRRQCHTGNMYEFDTVEITYKNNDDDFLNLKKILISELDKAITSKNEQAKKGEEALIGVPHIGNSRFELQILLSQAKTSIFLAGQVLVWLVKDEISANRSKSGYFKKQFSKWLCHDNNENRSINIMICDPSSEASVIHYALIFGEKYFDDLCDVIPIYQKWQRELEKHGLTIKVALAAPLTMTIIDGGFLNAPEDGTILFIPPAFEKKPHVRPAFCLRKKESPYIFEHYYSAFTTYFESNNTRPLKDVTKDELDKCRQLKSVYRKMLEHL